MDFFENQYKAKRNSHVIYLLFLLVIVLFVLTVMFLVGYIKADGSLLTRLTHPWAISAGIIAFVAYCVGSFIEWRRLSGGGKALARRLNAKPLYRFKSRDALNVHETSTEPVFSQAEKMLLNVVENMSIASGVGKPHVFVLPHEKSINAFVAGYKENDMVLVVTQGALTHLTEVELYALVGHEFSHIAHGDTQINLKLLVLLGGLQIFYELGMSLFDVDNTEDETYDYDYDIVDDIYLLTTNPTSAAKDFVAVLFILGLIITAISALGILFARLLKYALLRQREFLADAASVQYTRSHAVLDVLKKVRKIPEHGGITHSASESISHFFFASAIPEQQMFSSVLSTHPPIEKRIKALSESEYRLLKTQDEIEEKRLAKLAEKDNLTKQQRDKEQKRKSVEEIRKQFQFEYKEKSEYDGTPVEFVGAEKVAEPLAVMPKKTATEQTEINTIAALTNKTPNLYVDEFNATLIDPVLEVLKEPRGCLEMIAAALACHQQTNISPLDYEVSKKLYDMLQDKPRQQDVALIIQALDTLATRTFKIDSKAAKLYLNRLQHITHIDGHVSLLESLLLERVAFQLGLQPKHTQTTFSEAQLAIAFKMLIHALLVNDDHSPEERQQIRNRMQNLVAISPEAFVQAKAEKLTLSQCLNRLATQSVVCKKSIITTLETTMLADGKMTQDEKDILVLLSWRLTLGSV